MRMTSYKRFLRRLLVMAVLFSSAALGQDQAGEAAVEAVDFARDIQPILRDNCYQCHGEKRQRGGLRMDSRSLLLRGGDSAEPGVVPGDSESSYILKAITGKAGVKQMPPDDDPLSDEQVALLKRWIDSGADWPGTDADNAAAEEPDDAGLWSLQPVVDPDIPDEATRGWCSSAIDAFILRGLDEAELKPTPEADRRRLIRRVYFTLHGLLPTPEQMQRYLEDERADWYAQMVDDLLASPRYGERWARHWLDIVRYAETTGFETNVPRPNAYHYRDYVIRAFNEDRPYDQFILDQIAGDHTGQDAATGFLVAGAHDIVGSPDPELTAMQRSNELADMVNVASTSFMGLTVACARCHHHKFDPIQHADYFAMQAVFEGVRHGERPVSAKSIADWRRQLDDVNSLIDGFGVVATPEHEGPPRRPAANAKRNAEQFTPVRARQVRLVINATRDGGAPCIDELEVYSVGEGDTPPVNVALAANGATAESSGDFSHPLHQLSHINDGQVGNSRSWISSENGRGWVTITFESERVIDRVVWGRDRLADYFDRLAVDYRIEVATDAGDWRVVADSTDRAAIGGPQPVLADAPERLKSLYAQRASIEHQMSATRPYAGTFNQPSPTHRLYRGDPSQPREVVAPGTIAVLDDLDLAVDEPEQNRRLAFAKSLGDPEHPLTARVMVNRIWQYHFGEGLVKTSSDFGFMGAKPTHPELLDYLATRFVESGWSIKQMHRLILNSSTFRQDSVPNEDAMQTDSQTTLLWRFPPRRHEAEVIRDSILQATGKLDLTMYGEGFSVFKPNENYVRVYDPKEDFGPQEWRRMIYATQVRMERDPTFGAFDCPDGGQPTPQRSRSTTALQALNLFNSPFVLQQSELFAQRLAEEAGQDLAEQVKRAFEILYGRSATEKELESSIGFIDEHGMEALCRVLFNTNEFLFVE